jgi:hypothetical protein
MEHSQRRTHQMTRILASSLYALFGAIYLVAGVSVLLLRPALLPDAVEKLIRHIAQDNSNTLHIMQEFGSLLVFAGLITFWFIRHYDQSLPFHWAMTAFWGLFSLVHWFDIRGTIESVIGPLINSIPLALFVVVGLLRQSFDVPRASEVKDSLPRAAPVRAE